VKSRWQSALAGALTLTLIPVISGPVTSSPVISGPIVTRPVISSPVVSTSGSITSWFLLQRASAETQVFNALEELEKLPVKGRAPKTGYSRNQFGSQWTDTDRNGCDTRNDILKRDLSAVVFREKTRNCVVEAGVLNDPYSGQTISFQRGEKTSALIQIDHVVALSNAWQTGIFQSTVKVRTNFANDPLNLMAVKGSLNSQKGDGDAATWLPPNKAFRCAYVSRQIQVKVKYGLWVTKSEKEAMLRVLQSPGCNTEVVG
jgi:hypothetical protein